jgi:hypothetical protein
MKSFCRFLIVSTLTCFSIASMAKLPAEEKIKNFSPNPLFVAEFMSTFETIGEYFSRLENDSYISKIEHQNILDILKSRKIAASDQLIKPELKNKTLSWGKYSLSIEENSTFKTQDGVFIRYDSRKSADQVFADTLKALENKTTSGFKIEFGLPKAEAQNSEKTNALRPVGAATHVMATFAAKTLATGIHAASGAVTGVVGLLQPLTTYLRSWINKGSVVCGQNSYRLNFGFKYFEWNKEFEKSMAQYKRDFELGAIDVGHSESIHAFNFTNMALAKYILYPKKDTDFVTNEVLAVVFPNVKNPSKVKTPPEVQIPPCSKETAKKVELALKNDFKLIEIQLAHKIAQLKNQTTSPQTKPASPEKSVN